MIGTRIGHYEFLFQVPGAFTITDFHPDAERLAIIQRSNATVLQQINVFGS